MQRSAAAGCKSRHEIGPTDDKAEQDMNYRPPRTEVWHRFERQIRALARDIERRASAHGLPPCEWFVLAELEYGNRISLRELALASAVSLPAASKAVKRLAVDGLVSVDRVSTDKRLIAISITDSGMQFLMKERVRKELLATYHEVITPEGFDALNRSLGILASNLAKSMRL